MLRTAREHPIRLSRTAGDEVIDEHANVGVAALGQPCLASSEGQGGVNSGDQPLCGRFLVTRRPVDLPSEEQTLDNPGLERRLQIPRIEVVVFDRITRTRQVRVLKPMDGSHELVLHIKRKTR